MSDLGILRDDPAGLSERLAAAAARHDLVLTSGGVSTGEADHVRTAIERVGRLVFWRVGIKPGRPVAMGVIPGSGGEGAAFCGLPGNPVASMLAFMLFVRPAIYKLAGRTRLFPETFHARADEAMREKTGRREFKRGLLTFGPRGWEVRTTGPQGSGILTSMAAANCLIVIEEERGDVKPGETVLVEPLGALYA